MADDVAKTENAFTCYSFLDYKKESDETPIFFFMLMQGSISLDGDC